MLAATAEKGSRSGQAAINAQGGCLKASGQQPRRLQSRLCVAWCMGAWTRIMLVLASNTWQYIHVLVKKSVRVQSFSACLTIKCCMF
jgi:hypothetical protein